MAPSPELLGDHVQPGLTAGRLFVGSNLGCVLLWSSRHPYTDRESSQEEKQSIYCSAWYTERGYAAMRLLPQACICVAHPGSWRERSKVYIFTLICEACYRNPEGSVSVRRQACHVPQYSASLSVSNHQHNVEEVQTLDLKSVWKSRLVHKRGWGVDWSLLLEAQVANISLIDPDDAVVLLEESLLLGFSARLQALHEQAMSPGIDQMTVQSQTQLK